MRQQIALGLICAALSLTAGCTKSKKTRCEQIFGKVIEFAVQDAKANGADEAKLKELRETMPNQRGAYVSGCEKSSDAKIDCMLKAKSPDDAKTCMQH
jgi:hypothetical protein